MSGRVLIVEDERGIAIALSGLLKKEGHEVVVATSHADARAALDAGVDLVLTDLQLGHGPDGLAVLRDAKALRSDTPVVLITAHGSERVAVAAMKAGADDYLAKPFDNDEVRLVVRRLLDAAALSRSHRLLLARVEREHGGDAIVGTSPAMLRVRDTIARVADTELPVLVRGESGTGKELVAQALHQQSARRARPFVAVNSAAISRELVESELFGHERGAFTGAVARRVGKLEAADGGTLLLDELGDMPMETQAKLLRALETRQIERVGGARPIDVDVRVVAATHADLEADVERGRFRRDLYYRLRVVEITLPPLRERPGDVPLLVERLSSRIAARSGRPVRPPSPRAMQALAAHRWPGNVRELRNVLEQANALAEGPLLEPWDLALDGVTSAAAPDVGFAEAKRRAVEDFERRYLSAALAAHGGNVSRTADAIGMVRQSLQQKLRELGMR